MKKITIYKIILIILILIALVLITMVVKKSVASHQVETVAQTVIEKVESQLVLKSNSMEKTDVVKEIDEQIEGYDVVGIIKIPKIDVNYPILEETNKESLKLSITKFWGDKINQIGSVVLSGHNNLNNKMFGRIDKLENGDVIELTDNQLVTVKYQVFDKYVTDPNDISCILPVEDGKREVTLITCTDGNKNRLIIKARENM